MTAVTPGLVRPVRRPPVRPVAALAAVTGVAALLGVGGLLLALNAVAGASATDLTFWPMQVVAALTYGGVGGWLILRGAAGRVGPLFLVIALSQALALFGRAYAVRGLQVVDGLPLDDWAFWVSTWIWVPGVLTLVLVLPLVLPAGVELPSRGWRTAATVSLLAVLTATAGWALTPYDRLDVPVLVPEVGPHPLRSMDGMEAVAGAVDVAAAVLLGVAVFVALSAVVAQWRRATGADRHAGGWVLFGAVCTLTLQGMVVAWDALVLTIVAVTVLPLCCLVAMTRHRLWDLQLVVRRSLLYGGFTASVATAYLGTVGLVGGALGAGAGAPVVATGVVAILVLPMHHVLRRLVNRIVHGQAEEPAVTAARLGQRLGSAVAPDQLTDEVLPEILGSVAEALHLRHLGLRMVDGRTLAAGDLLDPVGSGAVELDLSHGSQLVGVLLAVPGRGGLTRSEQRALTGFAAQAAVAVHGILLAAELRKERERVVSAREEERRRLRSELHDGVGSALAAAYLQADTARHLLIVNPAQGRELLDQLVGRLHDVLADVRAVTTGLRPATLDDFGLAGALCELGDRSTRPICPVTVEVGELGEVPAAVEVAAYLCTAELVANACRHSSASAVRVRVHHDGAVLSLRVSDDGAGIGPHAVPGVGLASVRRRVEEVGGRIVVDTTQVGVTVDVSLPMGRP